VADEKKGTVDELKLEGKKERRREMISSPSSLVLGLVQVISEDEIISSFRPSGGLVDVDKKSSKKYRDAGPRKTELQGSKFTRWTCAVFGVEKRKEGSRFIKGSISILKSSPSPKPSAACSRKTDTGWMSDHCIAG